MSGGREIREAPHWPNRWTDVETELDEFLDGWMASRGFHDRDVEWKLTCSLFPQLRAEEVPSRGNDAGARAGRSTLRTAKNPRPLRMCAREQDEERLMSIGSDGRATVSALPAASVGSAEMNEALKSDLLMAYRAVVALEKRVNEYTVNAVEIKPQLIALKVHTESFPSTLREMRRSQTATQKVISGFETRLRNLEACVKGAGAES